MSGRTLPRVAVLKGGLSAEREVSLVSGEMCANALRDAGYRVDEIDAGRDIAARLEGVRPEVVFNALHGRWGEDGAVQGLLEWMAIPYTHSGVGASALAMDKARAKIVFSANALPVAESLVAEREAIARAHPMDPPYVVKPVNEGSSVGVVIVPEGANAPASLPGDAPARLMVERFVPGRELTVSVLGDRPLGVTEIIAEGWYDYHAKYAPGGSRHVFPAEIPAPVAALAMDHALVAHRALGCRGLTRTDFRWDETRGEAGLIVLETNTQPGMTPTSLAPEQAAHVGMDFAALCAWLVEDASCDR
ncbi:MAG: D-alanine--D-alanine ligase [Paracoccaceae bacterium]